MDFILNFISSTANSLAVKYNLNVTWFLIIYLLSLFPFYFGYFLILYGTTRHLKFKDILHLRFKRSIRWTPHSTWGLMIHLIGRAMPYAYIVFFGKNLSIWIYVIIVITFGFPALYLIGKIFLRFTADKEEHNLKIEKFEVIKDKDDINLLWEIYNAAFENVNEMSPCKQSYDKDHFIEAMGEPTIFKYILKHPHEGIIGIALITNDFKNTTWISPDYFRVHYPHQFTTNAVYYFIGLAIHNLHHGRQYSILLIEHIIDDIPHHAILGFDHSNNANPLLHYFTRIVRQAPTLRKTHIDYQHYHVVQRV